MAMAAMATQGQQPSDADLVRRVEAGDEASFEILYERYFPRVFRFVQRRLGNRADTEETVQEVFINIFSSMSGWRGDAPFEAWVLGLTRRTIARRFKKKRHPTVPLLAEEAEQLELLVPLLHHEPSPHECYEYRERIGTLERRARSNLTAEQWELFERHHLRNEPVRELARVLRKTEDAVKSNLYRARKVLFAR